MFFLKLHCVHDGGIVYAAGEAINEIRVISDDKGQWTRLQMTGSSPIEIKETAEEILELIAYNLDVDIESAEQD